MSCRADRPSPGEGATYLDVVKMTMLQHSNSQPCQAAQLMCRYQNPAKLSRDSEIDISQTSFEVSKQHHSNQWSNGDFLLATCCTVSLTWLTDMHRD